MKKGSVIMFLLSALSSEAQEVTRLSLRFLGDIMQHDSQIAAAYDLQTGQYDYHECFRHIRPQLESSDLTIGNLELTFAGPPYRGFPRFSAPDALLESLKDSGVDVLVTANNHSMDGGKAGLERTISLLDTFRLAHTGTFIDSASRAGDHPLMLEQNGFNLGLLNYTYGTNGIAVTPPNVINLIDTVQIEADLQKAGGQNPDLVIVFFHWGTEYQNRASPWQKRLAEFCLRHGAKIVIGSHPHVLQPMEWRRETDQIVAYSLGNFISGQRVRYRDGGAMLRVELEKISTDSSSRVFIRSADYELQYVHRDARMKYFLLPVQQFEGDTLVVKELASRQQLRQFASDSRTHLDKFNWNIFESEGRAVDSVLYVSISTPPGSPDSLIFENKLLKFYGVRRETTEGRINFLVGEFYDDDVAKRALEEVRSALPFAEAVLVGRRD